MICVPFVIQQSLPIAFEAVFWPAGCFYCPLCDRAHLFLNLNDPEEGPLRYCKHDCYSYVQYYAVNHHFGDHIKQGFSISYLCWFTAGCCISVFLQLLFDVIFTGAPGDLLR